MTQPLENLVLNPVEFTPALPEIDLSAVGIRIGPAAPDYGESSVVVERVKREIGEGATSRHWPSVECTIPLILSSDPRVPQATAYQPIEAFVAEVQRRGVGWIRRDMADIGGFAGSLGCPVDAAGITSPLGGKVSEQTLKLMRSPIWYATVEIEAGEAKGSGVRDLQFELAELLGTAPGLIRIQVKNEGTEDWRGCLVSIECDDFSAAPTALPKYEARELTLAGGSTSTEVSGAKVVKCPPLTSGWQTVLSSKIVASGHMTHVGPRRMAFRVEDTSAKTDAERLAEWELEGGLTGGTSNEKPAPQQVQWKLEWRALGAANWIQTREGSTPLIAVSPVVGGYQVIDLGECRPELAVTGNQRWEWRLQACVPAAGPQGTLQPLIRDFYPASTEQWMRVADTSATPIDGEPEKSAGTVVDATGVGTVTWTNPSNAATPGEGEAEAVLGANATSHYLKATNFGFAIPSGVAIQWIKLTTYRRSGSLSHRVGDAHIRIVKGGVVKETVDRAGELLSGVGWEVNPSITMLFKAVYGGDLWGQTWTPSDINSATFGAAIACQVGATGGTGFVDAIAITVAYSESANENRICFATRSIEFSDSGIRRQHVTDEVWGELVPEGFLPYSPPAGQGAQSMRALVVPSVGDFDSRADSATVKPNAKAFCRPGYLFAREAA